MFLTKCYTYVQGNIYVFYPRLCFLSIGYWLTIVISFHVCVCLECTDDCLLLFPSLTCFKAGNYPKSESGLPTPPAFALNNLTTEMNFAMPYNHHEMVLEEYPQRPGEPDCSFFLRTGDCKFKSNCKFHHPKNRISKPMKKSLPPSNKGLAIRPVSFDFGVVLCSASCNFILKLNTHTHPPTHTHTHTHTYIHPPTHTQIYAYNQLNYLYFVVL